MKGINITCYEKNVVNYSKKYKHSRARISTLSIAGDEPHLTEQSQAILSHISGNHACAEPNRLFFDSFISTKFVF
jgi:hypothetical protein